MRKVTVLILFLLLLFFVSCEKEINYKSYINNGAYEDLYEITSKQLQKQLSIDALYYKAVACYYLDLGEECSEISKLCLTLSDENRSNLLKMLLYKGDLESSCSAGKELYQKNMMNSSDKVQYYRSLVNSDSWVDARLLVDEIQEFLSSYDYALVVTKNKYPTKTILNACRSLYLEEGVSNRFIALLKDVIDIASERFHETLLEEFFEETFDGSSQYALTLGDFYYSKGYKGKAMMYWDYIRELFPNAYAARTGSLN